MKLTKRLLCLMLAVVLAFALCACGEEKKDDKTVTPSVSDTPSNSQQNNNGVSKTTGWADAIPDENFNDATLAW